MSDEPNFPTPHDDVGAEWETEHPPLFIPAWLPTPEEHKESGSPPARALVGPEARVISELLTEYLGSPPASADPDAEEVAFALLAAAQRVWERARPARGGLTTSVARETTQAHRPSDALSGVDRVQAAFAAGRESARRAQASWAQAAGVQPHATLTSQVQTTQVWPVGGPWGRGPGGDDEGEGLAGAWKPRLPRAPHDPIVGALLSSERRGPAEK